MVTPHDWTPFKVHKELLQTPPFVECDENTIRSKTPSVEEKLICQNRPKLLEHLVKALYDYVDIYYDMEYINDGIPQEMLQETEKALWCIHFRLEEFLDLRRRHALSVIAQSKSRNIHEETLRDAVKFLSEVFLSLTPDDYAVYDYRKIPIYCASLSQMTRGRHVYHVSW